jgi:hypothetical protein
MTASTNAGVSPQSANGLARALGWFSIGLGISEIIAPDSICKALGMRGKEGLVRAYGLREVAAGMGILGNRDGGRAPWVWSRVAGDALDLASLSGGLSEANPKKANVKMALASVAAITMLDLACAGALQTTAKAAKQPTRDYSRRVGMPRPPAQMRGAARDAEIPADMLTPPMMRYPQPQENTRYGASLTVVVATA